MKKSYNLTNKHSKRVVLKIEIFTFCTTTKKPRLKLL